MHIDCAAACSRFSFFPAPALSPSTVVRCGAMEMVLTCVHMFLLAPPNWAASDEALRAWQLLLLHIRFARRQPLVVELRTDRAIGRIEICLSHNCVQVLREEGRNYLNDLRGMVQVFGRLPLPDVDPLFDLGGEIDTLQVDLVADEIRALGDEDSSEDEEL
jgi:hypothetical protein